MSLPSRQPIALTHIMASITSLPNEILREIVLEAAGRSPSKNLRSTRQVSKRFESHALPIMYETLTLTAGRGLSPMARHVLFLESALPVAKAVKELMILGAGSEGQGDAFEFSIMGVSDVTEIARILPSLRRLSSREVFWSTRSAMGPQPAFSSLTSIEFHDVTLVTPGPFPANILHHLPHVIRTTLSFSASSPLDQAFNVAIENSSLSVPILEISASLPFPAETTQACINADCGSLESLSLEIIPISHPPFWTRAPRNVSIANAHLLQKLKVALAAAAFPPHKTENHTWTYARRVIMTTPRDTPLVTLIFDCSTLSKTQVHPRLHAFPTQDLAEISERMPTTASLHIILQVAANDEEMEWNDIIASHEGWSELAGRGNVTLGCGSWKDEWGPFARFLPATVYEGHEQEWDY